MSAAFDLTARTPLGFHEIAPAQVAGLPPHVRKIDVREPSEFEGELGHLEGAELVPLASLPKACAGWDKDQAILVVCKAGARGGKAAQLLISSGFKDVANLRGGMLAYRGARL